MGLNVLFGPFSLEILISVVFSTNSFLSCFYSISLFIAH